MKFLSLSHDATFKDAIQVLDRNGNGFLAIVDDSNLLLGILTDGDIRRAILDNKTELLEIINKQPVTMPEGTCRVYVKNQLKKSHKKHMPIVDSAGILKDVVTLNDDEFNLKPNWVVIMAGGLGTRLGALTKNVPKPMLQVGGKPMLQHIIELFVSHGFTKFMLSVNYKSEIIKEFFADGSKFGIEIVYLEETRRLGTGGALSLIDFELDEPFFVTNGDVITSIDYEDMLRYHKTNNSKATMGVRKSTHKIPYGVVESDELNNIVELREKPEFSYFINTGAYILEPEVISLIPVNEFYDLPTLFERLNKKGELIKSYEVSNYWIDMGQPEDYDLIRQKFEE